MSKSTWANVKKGMVVELGGRGWTVAKIKPEGKKRAKVTVERKGRTAKSVVAIADRVKILGTAAPKRPPLHDERGQAQRWATKKELEKALESTALPAGDPAQTKPPAKAKGSPWQTQADRIEEMLGEILQAKLVGVSTNEDVGYYVPPIDSSTVAAHLAVYHGGIPAACDDDETKMLRAHDAQHAAAAKGEGILEVNHWHTKRRPL